MKIKRNPLREIKKLRVKNIFPGKQRFFNPMKCPYMYPGITMSARNMRTQLVNNRPGHNNGKSGVKKEGQDMKTSQPHPFLNTFHATTSSSRTAFRCFSADKGAQGCIKVYFHGVFLGELDGNGRYHIKAKILIKLMGGGGFYYKTIQSKTKKSASVTARGLFRRCFNLDGLQLNQIVFLGWRLQALLRNEIVQTRHHLQFAGAGFNGNGDDMRVYDDLAGNPSGRGLGVTGRHPIMLADQFTVIKMDKRLIILVKGLQHLPIQRDHNFTTRMRLRPSLHHIPTGVPARPPRLSPQSFHHHAWREWHLWETTTMVHS